MGVTREQLHREVWAEPMTAVAKRYSVSSNYLARICKQLKIPHPSRGYWQQREAGQDVTTRPLPEAGPGDALEWARDGEEPRRVPMTASTPRTRTKKERREKHPVLVGAREDFEHARPPNQLFLDKRPDELRYVRPWKRTLVDLHVTRAQLDRALKVASELFNALEDRGMEVHLAPPRGYRHVRAELLETPSKHVPHDLSNELWAPGVPTLAIVGDVAFGITLFEIAEIVEMKKVGNEWVPVAKAPTRKSLDRPWDSWTSHRWLPTGRFGVHAYAAAANVEWESYWREAKPGQLSSMFAKIASDLEAAVPRVQELAMEARARREEWTRQRKAEQEEWARQQEAERRREQEQRRKEEELRREKDLEKSVARFRLARDIRDLVSASRAAVADAGLSVTAGSDLERRMEWALAYAERIDPVSELRAELARGATENAERCASTLGITTDPKAPPT